MALRLLVLTPRYRGFLQSVCSRPLMALALAALAPAHLGAQTLPAVTIIGFAPSVNSVKVSFLPVAGARDYRVYSLSNPGEVKYAGIVHLFPNPWSGAHFVTSASGLANFPYRTSTIGSGPVRLDVPASEIEVNGLLSGQPTTLVVEAVDQLGPMPGGNVPSGTNSPLYPKLQDTMSMLGSDMGTTLDNLVSINGQGPYTNRPRVIARSKPFMVQANGLPALPSGKDALQTFFDSFGGSLVAFSQVGTTDAVNGIMQFLMKTSAGRWDIFYRTADTSNSMPMSDHSHLMDVLFDGGTPGTNVPLHQGHGLASFSPQRNFDFSGGRVLHVTFEVDAHTDSRRWIGIQLAPALDPLFNWYPFNGAINRSDQGLFVGVGASTPVSSPTLDLYIGPNVGVNPTPRGLPILGAAGQAMRWAIRPQQNFQVGHGLDNRSRFDLFISQFRYAWYEDGLLVDAANLPHILPFTNAKVYFSHYLYHTQNEVQEVRQYAPWEGYWLNLVPYSDERHWNNMGVEVLPAAINWSKLPFQH